MAATSVSFFSVAILNEAIKSLRLNVQAKAVDHCHNVPHGDRSISEHDDTESTELITSTQSNLQMSYYKVIDGLLYALQTVLSFAMMLAVMSFSAWIFLATIFGTTLGNVIFLQRVSSAESFVRIRKCSFPREDEEPSIRALEQQQMTDEESSEGSRAATQSNNVITVELHC